jgi:D-alanyl-lipoteichoic acid acyltransferase DltB (MBOAT superfamily)
MATKFGQKTRKLFGKKAGKDILLYISMFVTWFCVGFWHGGSWKYICGSGLFFFIMIVAGLILQPLFDKLKNLLRVNEAALSWHLFQSLRSFLLFTFSVSFGRAERLIDGFRFWRAALHYNPWVLVDGSLYKLGLDASEFWIAVLGLLIVLLVSVLQLKGPVRGQIAKQNLAFRWLVYLTMFFAVIIFGCYGVDYNPADFIYAGF